MTSDSDDIASNGPQRGGRRRAVDARARAQLVTEIKYLCGGERTLEIGCGHGALVADVRRNGIDAFGHDWPAASSSSVAATEKLSIGSLSPLDGWKLPYPDNFFSSIVAIHILEYLPGEWIQPLLRELYRVCRRSLLFRVHNGDLPVVNRLFRDQWLVAAIAAGFRKHPRYHELAGYEVLENERGDVGIILEKIPEAALARYPLSALNAERDLHMDHTREAGRRADAHLIRYHWASSYIQPGDTVIDGACGLGYGSWMLATRSQAKKIIGIDYDGSAAEYAEACFASLSTRLEFAQGDMCDLSRFADSSVETIISFETVEHLRTPEQFFKEARRVLIPGGRLITSVPHLWLDESGVDPNPFHFHVYDWQKIISDLSEDFLIETTFGQNAGEGLRLPEEGRKLWSVGDPSPEMPESEWCLVVAIKSPFDHTTVAFTDSLYPVTHPPQHAVAFGRDYENPWLVRSMVSPGSRVTSARLLQQLAQQALTQSTPYSADTGAALCVLGYRLLEQHSYSTAEVRTFIELIQQYLQVPSTTAHGFRWHISLEYLLAELYKKIGDLEQAELTLWSVAQRDVRGFSPTLGTKTIRAAHESALLAVHRGDTATARIRWQRGLEIGKEICGVSFNEFLGDENSPLPFGFSELTEIVDRLSDCVAGLRSTLESCSYPDSSALYRELSKSWRQLVLDRYGAVLDLEGQLQALKVFIERSEQFKAQQFKEVDDRWNLQIAELFTQNEEMHQADAALIDERAQAMASMDEMIIERDHVIAAQKELIEERDRIILAQKELIEERYRALQTMEAMIQDRDEALDAQTTLIDERVLAMQSMEQMIEDRDRAIARQAALLEERYHIIQDMEHALHQRENSRIKI